MIGALVNLIIWLLILGILYAIVVYVVDNLIPDPPGRYIKVAAVVVIALAAVLLLIDLVGGGGVGFPKITVQ